MMRWIVFLMVAIPVLTAQSTLAHRTELFGARPDWLLILVVFVAFHARRRDAVLGAWVLGLTADLMTIERFGLIALSYVLVTVAIIAVREFLFRQRAITQFIATLIAAGAIHLAWMIYRRTLYTPTLPTFDDFVVSVLFVAVYSALWAPPIHACLLRLRRPMGFAAPRFGYAP